MKNLLKMYSKINEYEILKNEVSKAKETFEVKPFVKEFASIKKIVMVGRLPLSLFSIITGLGFLYYQFESVLGFLPAVVFAIALLLLVELLKSEIGFLAFKRIYQTGLTSLNLVLLLFLCLFFGLSVFLSVLGMKDIYTKLDISKQIHTQKSTTQLDSISKHYDKLLSAEKRELANFKKSVSWNDKINIYDLTTQNTLALHNKNIENLNTEKSKALAKIETKNNKEFSNIESTSKFNLFFWLGLSSTIEVLILGCLWFLMWFAYRVDKEAEIMNNEKFTLSKNDLQTYFNNNLLNLLGTNQNNNSLFLGTQAPVKTPISNEIEPQKIGFSLKENNTTANVITANVELKEGQKKCLHCSSVYTYKIHNQKFCSDKCRIENWELNKGKKLKFKK